MPASVRRFGRRRYRPCGLERFGGRADEQAARQHRSGKPWQNGTNERFSRSLRDECLNVHWFESLADAKTIVEAWRRDYNESRPHSALMDLTPAEYARQQRISRSVPGLMNAEN